VSGITFYKTKDLNQIKSFYISKVGMRVWLEQTDCVILKHDNMLLGFCERDESEIQGTITFFYDTEADVDEMYEKMQEHVLGEPEVNDKYRIYRFYARDPEDRRLEFQSFRHQLDVFNAGDNLLISRRSIREYEKTEVPDEVLWKVFELCRFAPTSKNCQAYYFLVIRRQDMLEQLADVRGGSSSPISRAPMAVAICTDPEVTRRPVQDGCIAAYHFLLAAKLFNLGTCWIAAMDRDDVKQMLGIPSEHYIATITPIGYPAERPEAPARKEALDLVRFVD
jgi:nitroreductase